MQRTANPENDELFWHGVVFDSLAAEWWHDDSGNGWQYEGLGGGIISVINQQYARAQLLGAHYYCELPTVFWNCVSEDGKKMALCWLSIDSFSICGRLISVDDKLLDIAVSRGAISARFCEHETARADRETFVSEPEFADARGEQIIFLLETAGVEQSEHLAGRDFAELEIEGLSALGERLVVFCPECDCNAFVGLDEFTLWRKSVLLSVILSR